jgi:glucose-1-phosphate thymidylyltransferase
MLLQAANFIQAVEERQGLKIGCPEEIAYRKGFNDRHHFLTLANQMLQNGYGRYLLELADDL